MTGQQMDALAKANRVRLARAALRTALDRGAVTVNEVLATMPDEAITMTVYDLLTAQHRWGRVRTLRTLRALKIGERKLVGELTARQHGDLMVHVSVSRMASGARPKADR